jgi:hypothetical protein
LPLCDAQRTGDSAGHTSALAKSTESELATIGASVSGNKSAVIDMLLKSVTSVA